MELRKDGMGRDDMDVAEEGGGVLPCEYFVLVPRSELRIAWRLALGTGSHRRPSCQPKRTP